MPEFVPSEEITGNQIRPRRVPFASQLPGALTATIGWLGFSFLYSFYVDHISNYSSIYGSHDYDRVADGMALRLYVYSVLWRMVKLYDSAFLK